MSTNRPTEGGDSTRMQRMRIFSDKVRHFHHEYVTHDPRALDALELIIGLTRLEARLTQDFERHVHRPLGLSWAGFRILNVLWVYGSIPQHEIAEVTGSTRATVSSVLNTLEIKGLIERSRAVTDRRHLIVELTAIGNETLKNAVKSQTVRERAWTNVLRDDQMSEFLHLLRTLVDQDTPPL